MGDIQQIVAHIVHTYGTSDPYQLSQKLNLHLIPSRTPSGLWGVFVCYAEEAFFSYDITASATQQSEYIAHGLGHYLLHRQYSSLFIELDEPGPSVWEAEAREFAHYLRFGAGCTRPPAPNMMSGTHHSPPGDSDRDRTPAM
ncbi:hypothetical protein JZ785_04420 [Alicyclobacillus curvatus]|nr:hypothetical protein JZ785_04420 [Alicyclobacillus curvatus]